jgi:sugar phosphate isomerase/epimerase
LKGLIELASEFGGIVNLGRVRGFVDDHQTPEEAEVLFIDSLTNLHSFACGLGVQLVIEPVNRYESNFINTVEQCASLLCKYSLTDIGIMPDTFHMNIEDALIGKTLEKYSSLIKYIHVADSNRESPGNGHLDFDDIFSSLAKIQYEGWVSVEVLPFPDPDTAAQRSALFLLPFLDRAKREKSLAMINDKVNDQ